jgi:ATP-dependent Clp protease ATP-binding subunit ClpB
MDFSCRRRRPWRWRADISSFAPEHLLKVLIDDPEGMAAGLIKTAAGGQPDIVPALARQRRRARQDSQGRRRRRRQLYLAPEMARVFEAAEKLREEGRRQFVTAERLLQALAIERPARRQGRAEGRRRDAAGAQ